MRCTSLISIAAGLLLSLLGINCGDENSAGPEVVKTDTYVGTIDSIPVAQLGGAMGNHTFFLSFFSDGSFTIDDSLSVPAMQLKVGSPVEIGTFTKSATAYTLSPSSCADTSGRMSEANCSAPVQTATISGNSITIPAFFGGLLDLVMTKR